MAVIQLDTDAWLHVIEMLGGGALLTKMLRVVIEMRDSLKDLGEKEPPTGLFRTVDGLTAKAERHETWLVQIRTFLGLDGVAPPPHLHKRQDDE